MRQYLELNDELEIVLITDPGDGFDLESCPAPSMYEVPKELWEEWEWLDREVNGPRDDAGKDACKEHHWT